MRTDHEPRLSNRTFACASCGQLRRAVTPDFAIGAASVRWPRHCGRPMRLLGFRAAQAAARLTPARRVQWLKLGARVRQHAGKKRWRPVLREERLTDAYPTV